VSIYNCGECGGHWLSEARLDVIAKRREYVMPEPVKQKMIEIADASNTSETLTCRTCEKEMLKEQFKHWSDIQIDRCPQCDGIWLDRGELEKCQIYWEYLQDHPAEWETFTLIEREAALGAELQSRRALSRPQSGQSGEPAGAPCAGVEQRSSLIQMLTSVFSR
jgi:Zn-finger nucleic acid-binding protein